jgi:hypothetical protein
MSYRDVSHSLQAYRERIQGELDEARQAAKEAADRASKVAILEKELAETEDLIEKMGTAKRGLPVLEDVRIAAPCKANWDEMVGDDHVRFCGLCEKNVYNLSSLSRDEAEALLVAREGKMCVRMYRREDGTVLTDDCPVGVKKRRRRRAALAAVGGGLMAAASALGLRAMTMMGKKEAPIAVPVAVAGGLAPMGGPSWSPPEPEAIPPPPAVTTTPTAQKPDAGHWLAGRSPPRLPIRGMMGVPAPANPKTADPLAR